MLTVSFVMQNLLSLIRSHLFIFAFISITLGASLVAQTLKHLPAMRETWFHSLGQEGPLEKEMATHSITLAWKIP